MHMARYKDSSHVVTFNSETEDFDIIATNEYISLNNFTQQAPFLTWDLAVKITELPTKETTVGKIIPTKEVSGLNNLNVIEDEPTDI